MALGKLRAGQERLQELFRGDRPGIVIIAAAAAAVVGGLSILASSSSRPCAGMMMLGDKVPISIYTNSRSTAHAAASNNNKKIR